MTTAFEKLQQTFREIGVPFELTDTSDSYPEDAGIDGEIINTIIMVNFTGSKDSVYFEFDLSGNFKEVHTDRLDYREAIKYYNS
jgi:hypothetical protein